jgi:ABC-type Na+ efflux pump permease subunit
MTTPSRPSFDELAAGELDAQDVDTLARMAALYDRLDPVPEGLVDRIRFGITLDALHAEIADLQRSDDLAGVRSEGAVDAQTVTFTSSSLTTMVTITPAGADRVRIDGWAAPGGGVTVELRIVDETLTVTADADGL